MQNSERYSFLKKGEMKIASNMAVIPREQNYRFATASIEKSLAESQDFKLNFFSEFEDEDKDFAEKYYRSDIEYLGEKYHVELYIFKTSDLHLEEYSFANHIDDQSLEIARCQAYCLGTSMSFGENNLTSFHLQLKIMNAVVPSASLVVDLMSYRLLSPLWFSMTAQSSTPPSPDYLYILHCVYDNDKEEVRRHWFHTHGLQRCGSVELEMVNIALGAEQMHVLLNMTVKKFLSDTPLERERFAIGYDGIGINLCWLRWEEALKDFPEKMLGCLSDREGDTNVHSDPGGVLFAVEDGNMTSPEIYAQTLAENPIYYITTEETNRMSALAKERFDLFQMAFDRYYTDPDKRNFLKKMLHLDRKKDEQSWAFLAKLGLSVDNPETGEEKEHLWFDVRAIDGNKMTAKLLNQPYWISGLNEGNVGEYSVELLTDWVIYSPDNTLTPDTIYQLAGV